MKRKLKAKLNPLSYKFRQVLKKKKKLRHGKKPHLMCLQ